MSLNETTLNTLRTVVNSLLCSFGKPRSSAWSQLEIRVDNLLEPSLNEPAFPKVATLKLGCDALLGVGFPLAL
jgi:hypothetical protein